jgi:uncharacterized protein (TIGR01732 family)
MPLSRPRIGYVEGEEGFFMYGGYGPCVGGYGCGGYEGGRGYNYGGSTFVLIVVLFILLIIVGKSFL